MKKLFKVSLILLCFLIQVFGGNGLFVYADGREPLLHLQGTGEVPTGKAGENISISLAIKNTSFYSAQNISITPKLEGEAADALIPTQFNNSYTIEKLGKDEWKNITLSFHIEETAKQKVYPVKLDFEYVNAYGDGPFTDTRVVYVKVQNDNTPPRLMISDVKFNPETFEAGKDGKMIVYVSNIGTLPAKKLSVTLDGLDKEGFTVVDNTNEQHMNIDLNGGDKWFFNYHLKAAEEMETGTYPLTMKFKFQDDKNEMKEDEQTIYLNVQGKEEKEKKAELVIEKMEQPKDKVEADEEFPIRFSLHNKGLGTAKNIKVTVNGNEVIVPKTASVRMVQTLEADRSEPMGFILAPTADAKTRNYPIEILVEYEDEKEDEEKEVEKYSITQYVGVNVENEEEDEDENKTVPKIIISEYSFEPGIVRAGQNFTLKTSFLNTSSVKAIQNIKIFLTVDEESNKTGSVFTPVQSSNTFYIDHIAPGQQESKEMQMYTIPDAQPKTYTITANFEYEDEEGTQYTSKELIGIPVVQPSRLEMGEVNIDPQGFVQQEAPIMVEFYNMGQVTIRNLMVKLEGDFDSQDGEYFYGNLEPGDWNEFDATIIPTQAGEVTGKLLFSYDDTAGDHHEIEKEFTLKVEDMPEEPEMGEDGMMHGGKFPPGMEEPQSWWQKAIKNKFVWMGAIIVGFVIAGLIVRRIRKKKKGMTFDEDF